MMTKRFLNAVEKEYLNARSSGHAPFNSAHEGWAVIKEELDELWGQVLLKREKRDHANMLEECVQIAAMSLAFAMEVCRHEAVNAQLPEKGHEKLVALLGGGDWHDASVDHIVVPGGLDLDEAAAKRRSWYENEYLPSLQGLTGTRVEYLSFVEWLLKEHPACRFATEDEIELFEDH